MSKKERISDFNKKFWNIIFIIGFVLVVVAVLFNRINMSIESKIILELISVVGIVVCWNSIPWRYTQ